MYKDDVLDKEELAIQKDIENGLYEEVVDTTKKYQAIAQKTIKSRGKDTTMSLRINSKELEDFKKIANEFGLNYQSYLTALIHNVNRRKITLRAEVL
ncbi:MAG: hypothetical protein LBH46_01965 [Rickettsiales bacterium]|jgi:predicted DNA binding CopG/RHH family protein|nr:hypothetical protein [Rickettsiales bacterium]